MARRAIFCSELTAEMMNSGQAYRVKFSYGVFSVTPTTTGGTVYYHATKRAKGKLFKVYVGKCGTITFDRLREATTDLQFKAIGGTGTWYLRDNVGRGRT